MWQLKKLSPQVISHVQALNASLLWLLVVIGGDSFEFFKELYIHT